MITLIAPLLATLLPGIIAGGSNLIGQGLNAVFNRRNNRRMEDYNYGMYERQRADSLADWNRMNEYNSPAAQMKRFEEAGLNKNLIYGQTNTAPAVRSSSVEGYSPKPTEVNPDIMQAMFMMIYDLAKTSQETLNLKQIGENLKIDASIKGIQRDSSQLSYDTQSVLYGTTIRKAHADAYNAELTSKAHVTQNKILDSHLKQEEIKEEIARRTKETSVSTALQRYNILLAEEAQIKMNTAKTEQERNRLIQDIKNLEEMNKILKSDVTIKEVEAKFAGIGILKGDNAIFRAIQGIWSELFTRLLGE